MLYVKRSERMKVKQTGNLMFTYFNSNCALVHTDSRDQTQFNFVITATTQSDAAQCFNN